MTKNKKKIYYIVFWNPNCWDAFLQYQIQINLCYKLRKGYLYIDEYSDDPKDARYICDEGCHRDL